MNGFMLFSATIWIAYGVSVSPFTDLQEKFLKGYTSAINWWKALYYPLNIFCAFTSAATLTGANFFFNVFILSMWCVANTYTEMLNQSKTSNEKLERVKKLKKPFSLLFGKNVKKFQNEYYLIL